MRKHYVLAGLTLAAIVAAVIVVVGSVSSGSSGGTTTPSASVSLPPGHPSVAASAGAGQTPDYAPMITSLEKKYAAAPDDTKTALSLANAYLMNNQPDKAVALYDAILARQPSNVSAKVQLAMALHAQGHDHKALTLLTGIIAKDPNDQAAHYNLAILYFAEQKSDQAKNEWTKAAQIDPSSSLGKSAQNFVDLMNGQTTAPSSN